jgi:uncharacterized protein YqgC (DUF456 family)
MGRRDDWNARTCPGAASPTDDIVTVLVWLLALVLIALGVAGTVLPALPGPILVFAGVLVAAWIDGFTRIGVLTLVVLGVMTAAAHVVDLASAAAGVNRSGASRRAVAGAAVGTAAGLFFGIPGLIVGPFAGAVLAELTVRRDLRAAGRAGLFATLGFAMGLAAKLAVVFAMIGIAIAAFFL